MHGSDCHDDKTRIMDLQTVLDMHLFSSLVPHTRLLHILMPRTSTMNPQAAGCVALGRAGTVGLARVSRADVAVVVEFRSVVERHHGHQHRGGDYGLGNSLAR